MDKQLFEVAGLIITESIESPTRLNTEEVSKLKQLLLAMLETFTTSDTYYATNGIKKGLTKLPYNSMVTLPASENRLILHFTFSYNKPRLFIMDTEKSCARNYVNAENLRLLLNKGYYQTFTAYLHYPKDLSRLFKNVPDMNLFVEKFEKMLEQNKNPHQPSGYDCFSIEL